jgi:hypothetical protein
MPKSTAPEIRRQLERRGRDTMLVCTSHCERGSVLGNEDYGVHVLNAAKA